MKRRADESIEKLVSWYSSMCNGDWEHQYTIRIETLDNPGWSLKVDLAETSQEKETVPKSLVERSADDWVAVEVKGAVFRAYGGPGNLSEMIGLFLAFVEGKLNRDSE